MDQPSHSSVQSFIYGGIAGAVARTSTAPIERVKILRQIRASYNQEGLVANLNRIYQREGIYGFWRGNASNLYRIVPQQGVLFGSYRLLEQNLTSPLLIGALSGGISMAAVYPMKVIRTRMTVQINRVDHPNIIHLIRNVPPSHLYRGINMALFGVIPFHAINYYVYQKSQKQLGHFWAGCFSAGTAISITYPTDLMTRKFQLAGTKYNREHYSSIFSGFRQYYHKVGIRGFYQGMLAAQLRLVPSNGIAFMMYEQLRRRFS